MCRQQTQQLTLRGLVLLMGASRGRKANPGARVIPCSGAERGTAGAGAAQEWLSTPTSGQGLWESAMKGFVNIFISHPRASVAPTAFQLPRRACCSVPGDVPSSGTDFAGGLCHCCGLPATFLGCQASPNEQPAAPRHSPEPLICSTHCSPSQGAGSHKEKGYGLLNILLRSTFSLQYGHVCFFPTMHQPRMQNS